MGGVSIVQAVQCTKRASKLGLRKLKELDRGSCQASCKSPQVTFCTADSRQSGSEILGNCYLHIASSRNFNRATKTMHCM
ncbi:hypothetical protein V6N12_011248 [Hibiscus sabdariffa]|uniref:Kazal-like domain-containing protein n=1 Tax=Hibiscus sabdariffa TaxID=183260 RepID=A0ABR2EP60_9ROSI